MEAKILAFVQEISEKKGEIVTLTTDLFENGILDSMGIILLLDFLLEEFGIVFSSEDLQFENYQSVEKIVRWVKTQMG